MQSTVDIGDLITVLTANVLSSDPILLPAIDLAITTPIKTYFTAIGFEYG